VARVMFFFFNHGYFAGIIYHGLRSWRSWPATTLTRKPFIPWIHRSVVNVFLCVWYICLYFIFMAVHFGNGSIAWTTLAADCQAWQHSLQICRLLRGCSPWVTERKERERRENTLPKTQTCHSPAPVAVSASLESALSAISVHAHKDVDTLHKIFVREAKPRNIACKCCKRLWENDPSW
jgi:hypothetical protein